MFKNNSKYNLITILGPTATGKTTLAAHLAYHLGSSVISADSRQVYRGMDIGTGKDLSDYIVNGIQIQAYLTDIVDAGYKYNLYEFQRDFYKIYEQLIHQNKLPVLCGGSGLYIQSVVEGYNLTEVPINENLRNELKNKSIEELASILLSLKKLHNTTDIIIRKRIIRAIEIEMYAQTHGLKKRDIPDINSLYIGIDFDRDTRRNRITERLYQRLNNGMIEEVQLLLKKGIPAEDLVYYGLEYKFITLYLTGKLQYEQMVEQLNIAIHQFAKRQMTWFRKMEREGFEIHWLDGNLPLEKKIENTLKLLQQT